MIKLRQLLNEGTGELIPKDIYNFYFLFSVSSYQPQALQSDYGKFIQDEYLKALKFKYTALFKRLIFQQLVKYAARNRVDADFQKGRLSDPNALTAGDLHDLMKKTFRSDMQRRNEVWIMAAEFLKNLETSQSSKDIYLWIDRLNSAVHNTQTAILGKASYDLVTAYDRVHHAKSLNDYAQFVDKDLRQLLDQTNESVEDELLGGKRITADTPKGFSPTPVFRDTSPDKKDDEEDKTKEFDFPLEENNLKVSPSDRENNVFMTGLKLALQDKKQGNKRNLKGYPEDFIRGYKTVPQDSWWDKINDRLTSFASDFGKSYGKR